MGAGVGVGGTKRKIHHQWCEGVLIAIVYAVLIMYPTVLIVHGTVLVVYATVLVVHATVLLYSSCGTKR